MERFEEPIPLRVSNDEAKQVFELWAERQRQRDQAESQPSVRDIAEGLHISETEVHGLLIEVRARQLARTPRRGIPVAAAVVACFVLLAAVVVFGFMSAGPTSAPVIAPTSP